NATGGASYHLLGTFEVPQDATVTGVACVVDLLFWERNDTPAFWELLGCSLGTMRLSTRRPVSGCNDDAVTLCGAAGDECDGLLPDIGRTPTMPMKRSRVLFQVNRATPGGVVLHAGTSYFGFELTFFMDNAASCTGCSDKVAITWNQMS